MKDSRAWGSLSALLSALGLAEGPRKALVVEDDAAVREGLSSALAALGHAVDAREGVDRGELPLACDVAFLDHYFLSSTLTGTVLVPELVRANPRVRILAMSGDAGKNAEMLRLGATLAVAKPALRRLLR